MSYIVSQFQPKLIRTEEENEKALAVVEELMHRLNRSPEENELCELLVALIKKFEQEYYLPGTASIPHSMLLFLMEQRHLKQTDLVGVIGSEQVALEVIADQCEISKAQAMALGDFFHIDPELFISTLSSGASKTSKEL